MSNEERIERLQAAQACRNLAARLVYYDTAGQYDEARAIFDGYTPSHGEGLSPLVVHAHALDTEYLAVASDGGSAVGLWFSPGSITSPAAEGREGSVSWDWSEYRFGFANKDGGWKISSLERKAVFKSGYLGEGLSYTPYVLPELPECPAVGERDSAEGRRLAVIESAQECRNLMGRFCRMNAASMSVAPLWAGLEDDLLICPQGELRGSGAARAPEGGVLYELDTEILEVDRECRTAIGCWNSPGNGGGHWYWGKLEVIFMRCEAGWRIHRLAYYPVFKTAMAVPWTQCSGYPESETLERLDCRWYPDRIHPAGRPEIPTRNGSYLRLSIE